MRKIIVWVFVMGMMLSFGGCQLLGQDSLEQDSSETQEETSLEASREEEESSASEESSAVEEEESSQEEESEERQDSSLPEEDSTPEESQESEEDSVSEEERPEESDVMQAYLDVIQELTEQYGEGAIGSSGLDGQNVMSGLGIVRLLDMNGDGIQELYCAYAQEGAAFINYQQLYQYREGEAVVIFEGAISNNGTDVSPMTELIYKGENVYLADGRPLSLDGTYLRVIQGGTEEAFRFVSGYMSDDEKFYINDEEVTQEEYQAEIDAFLEGATVVDIWYYGDYNADTGYGVDPMNLQRTQDVIAEIQSGINQ